MTVAQEKYHHGRSPAGWASSVIAILGSIVGTVGFFMDINWTVVFDGFALLILAPIVGGTLHKMGYGTE